jgi:hypothetical protein
VRLRPWHDRRSRWLLALLAWPVVTLAVATQNYTYRAGLHLPITFSDALRYPAVEFFFWAIAAPLIYDLALGTRWPAMLLAGVAATDLVHALYRASLHELVYPHIPEMAGIRFAALVKGYAIGNLIGDVGFFATLVGLAQLALYYQRDQTREREWAADRRHVLEAQLHPHFLFNTLNSIATLMHEDVDAADEMMAKLATLLRRTLNRNGAYEIPLREELEILEIYLDIQRTRFPDRLTTAIDADPAALDAMVPRLILQPIVENAVRHGISRRTGPGRIEVRARCEDGRLCIAVQNDGAGWREVEGSGGGLGLANTRARLAQHYENDYRFDLHAAADGGARAEIAVPMRLCASAH